MGFSNFIYVFADFGVGSGIVVNGQLYRGMTGDAGWPYGSGNCRWAAVLLR